MIKLHCPFRVTIEEAMAIRTAHSDEDLEICPEETIPAGDYKVLLDYIENCPDGFTCVRVFASLDYSILDLPITRPVILLIYLTSADDPSRHDLVAVTGLNPLDGLVEAWRLPSFPEGINIYPEPTIC